MPTFRLPFRMTSWRLSEKERTGFSNSPTQLTVDTTLTGTVILKDGREVEVTLSLTVPLRHEKFGVQSHRLRTLVESPDLYSSLVTILNPLVLESSASSASTHAESRD